MFIRVKSTPNSPRKSVQIVESFRQGKKVKQRIVKHIGIAHDDEELRRLREFAEFVKARILHRRRRSLIPPDETAELVIRANRKLADEEEHSPLPLDFRDCREEERLVTGIHEIYGRIYRELGFDRVLSVRRQRVSHRVLYHTVMARIANPESKRARAVRLEEEFGFSLSPEKIYRMMDMLDDETIACMRDMVTDCTRRMFPEPIDILFFDCTTLYFESDRDDELRKKGFSKDGKHADVQVLFALLVTRFGLPISYQVFPGNSWEGHSFLPVLEELRQVYSDRNAVYVADAGMFSKDNLDELEAHNCVYIVGAKLKNLTQAMMDRIVKTSRYRSVAGTDLKVGVFRYQGRRLVVGWNPRRARKDAHDRKKAIERLQAKLKKSKNPRQHLGRSGTHRFLRVEGEARLEIDEEAVQRAARWDGILGVVTNVRGLKVTEVFGKYTGLWEVEESFRITKHDMRIRPVFHWKPRRVRAHLAIAFMAFSCVRHLEYRVRMQQKRLSPRVIHKALTRVQCSIVYDTKTERWYGLPSKPSTEARMLYRLMGLPLNTVPFALEEGNVVPSQTNIPNKSTR